MAKSHDDNIPQNEQEEAPSSSVICADLLDKNGWTVIRVDPWSIKLKQENGDTWIVRESDMLFENHVYNFLTLFI